MKLMIGAGYDRRPGWKTLDARPETAPDFFCTVPPLPPEIASLEAVEMIHFLGHLYPWDGLALLNEIFSLMVPRGGIVIECPNMAVCASVLLGYLPEPPHAHPGQFSTWGLWGDPTHRDPLMMIRWGYSPVTLRFLLEDIGFRNVVVLPATSHQQCRDFRIEARK
jgi:hypothetical protein